MRRLDSFIAGQLRRPTGRFGRYVLTPLLDRANRELIEATLSRLELGQRTSYLDVGFGGGAALRLAARQVLDAPIYGVDFSPDVVQQGQRRHDRLIGAGRLSLLHGDIVDMPLRDGLVDRVSTMNTVYFWPAPGRAAEELLRVLAPGGRAAVAFTGAQKMASSSAPQEGFEHYEPERVERLLRDAGFSEVQSHALHGRTTEGGYVTVGSKSC